MYVDPSGEIAWWVIALIVVAVVVVVDTVVETTILMNAEEYKAENVYNDGKVEIPNSALFNNPIAQYVYSNYLYENVKNENGENFFTGDVYDIVGEWQMHNVAFWAPVAIASQGGLINIGIGIVGAKLTHESSIDAQFGSSLEAESDRWYVYYPSNILKWINKISE